MPGDSGVTVVTCLRGFYFSTRGCGCIRRPAFPRALWFEGRTEPAQLGRNLRRENERD